LLWDVRRARKFEIRFTPYGAGEVRRQHPRPVFLNYQAWAAFSSRHAQIFPLIPISRGSFKNPRHMAPAAMIVEYNPIVDLLEALEDIFNNNNSKHGHADATLKVY
jgi:hypothetical protein